MKNKFVISVTVAIFALMFIFFANAFAAETNDFYPSADGSYTIECYVDKADEQYLIVVVAGDYIGKDMPEISCENIIYIDQTISDSDKKIKFSAFIPMTESVGTVYIGGGNATQTAGLLANDCGLAFVGGRLIGYSGNSATVTIPKEIVSVDSGLFDACENVENIIIENPNIQLENDSFAKDIKLFFSPLANDLKRFAIENGYAYGVLGDYTENGVTDAEDMLAILKYFSGDSVKVPQNFDIIFDLDFNGKVNLKDVSVLLEYLSGKISDFFKK